MSLTQFIASIEAGILANLLYYIICKWLDGND